MQHSDNIGDGTSSAIMSSREIQRQRRNRQLEETQRLLDQFADAGVAVNEQGRVSSSNDSVRSGRVSSAYGVMAALKHRLHHHNNYLDVVIDVTKSTQQILSVTTLYLMRDSSTMRHRGFQIVGRCEK